MDSEFKVIMNYLSTLEKLYFRKLLINYFENIWIKIMLKIKSNKCATFWRKKLQRIQTSDVCVNSRQNFRQKVKYTRFCFFKEICNRSLIILGKVIYLTSHIEQHKNKNIVFWPIEQSYFHCVLGNANCILCPDLSFSFSGSERYNQKEFGGAVLIDGDSWPFLTDKSML